MRIRNTAPLPIFPSSFFSRFLFSHSGIGPIFFSSPPRGVGAYFFQCLDPLGEIHEHFSRRRVDYRSLRSSPKLRVDSNGVHRQIFFSIKTVTKDEWTCLYKIIN
jgi:hypothetical protein